MGLTYHELRDGAHQAHNREPDFREHCDVLVAGLGTAGALAAIAAAQEGMCVIGLERASSAGGMCTMGSVNGYYYGQRGGFFEQVDEECRAMSGTVYRDFSTRHPEAKKYALERRLEECGVHTLYDSVILGVYEERGSAVGARLLAGGRLFDVACAMLLDATSDGHILRLCGVPAQMGRPSDGTMEPFTSVRVFLRPDGSLGRTNWDSGYVNQYDDAEFSRAILAAHARHTQALRFEDEAFLYVSPQIGVREGLRFEGEQTMTLEDILENREYADTLFYAYSDIDRHGIDFEADERTYRDWRMVSNLSTVTVKVAVPFGALVPRGWKGLLSCGRCLSCDAYAASSAVRMVRDMHRLGEACGVAAARLVRDGTLDFPRLRAELDARGCYDSLPGVAMGFDFPSGDRFTPVYWMTEEQAIREALSTDAPGVAIWSCRRLGSEAIGGALCRMMEAGDEMLRFNAAIALGITGDRRALPVLREIIRKRRAFFFTDCRRSNQQRSAIAVHLCGVLGDDAIVPELLNMLQPAEFERAMYHEFTQPSYKYGIQNDFNLVYFTHFYSAAAALAAIAERCPALRETIRPRLLEAVRDGAYIRRITPETGDSPLYKTSLGIRSLVLRACGEAE